MMYSPRSLATVCVTLLLVSLSFAQNEPLIINTFVAPPYSASYADYFTSGSQVTITILNTSTQTRSVYLAGSLATSDQSVMAEVAGGQPWNAPPLEVLPGSNEYTGEQLQSFAGNGGGDVQYTGITQEQIVAGLLPEGDYTLCLRAYDYYTNDLLSGPDPLGCSNTFNISWPAPPMLIAPSCGEMVTPNEPQLLIFMWQLMDGFNLPVEFHFRLARLFDENNPQAALESSTDLVYEETTTQTVLVYNQTFPALTPGQMYAWNIQAVDASGSTLFQSDGYSPPCTFTYQAHDGAGFQMVYPFPGDTLPWSMLPVIARFDPHPLPAQTGRFNSKLRIAQDGQAWAEVDRKPGDEDILWEHGPFISQRDLLNQAGITMQPPFDQEMAQHINLYERSLATGTDFYPGHVYTFDADLRINTYEETDVRYGDVTTYMVSGMGTPQLTSPEHNAVLEDAESEETVSGFADVPLRFFTSAPPTHLLPPYPIYIIGGNGVPEQTTGRARHTWRMMVSRNADLTAPDLNMTGEIGSTLQLIGLGQQDEQRLRDSLYKEVTVNFNPPDTGWYYWNVSWMGLVPGGPNVQYPYIESGVQRFHIGALNGASGNQTADTEPGRPAECLAECRRIPTPMEERVPVMSTAVGDTIKVGLFDMRITSITHSGGFANGEGLVHVPVMKAQLRVAFSQARINAGKRLYDGVVNGLYDNSGVIPAGWTAGGSMAAGFNPAAATAIDDFLQTGGRLVSQFTGNQPMGLPIGIDKELPDGRTVIGILGVQFTDTIARLNAGMGLPIHGVGTTVGLGNMAIPFHPGGIGDVSEEATLYLLGDINAPIGPDTLRLKGARFAGGFTAVQDSGTFVAWDCHGFRAITLDAQWRFSEEHLREDLPNGDDGTEKIVAALKVRTGRAGLFGRVDFNKPFHVNGLDGWGFDVQEAWLDLASYMNPPDMEVPLNVATEVGLADDQTGMQLPTWEGLYLKRAVLRMPPSIERTNSNERTALLVRNMIVNGTGLTASIRGSDIIPQDEGTLGGWGFSIDTLRIDIVANSLHQAGFGGRVHLPVTDTLLAYSAMIVQDLAQDDKYIEFLLRPTGTIEVPMWVASMDLLETSYLRAVLAKEDTSAFAKVSLNGKLTIDGQVPGLGWMNFRDIAFQDLTFQTDAPYTNIDDRAVFSLASPQKSLGGSPEEEDDAPSGGSTGAFPISVTRVTVERRNLDGSPMAGVGFDINLDLSGDVNIFTATTRIAVLGKLNTSALHQWGHHSVELDSIGISGETGAVKIQGGLRWYNGDGTYGDGINGSVRAWFLKGAVEVAASAQFGKKNGIRYWYADAMIAKDNGFSPGQPFNVYGFGGGAWYHMKRTGTLPSAEAITTAMIANQDDMMYTPGLTLSQVTYVPDANENFGFKATVIFGDGGSGRAYNGDLSAGMTFSATGGVSTAFLLGNVFLMCERNGQENAPVWGNANITFDFPNDVFSANFTMSVKVPGGTVVGPGPNYRAGAAELLVSPDTWHFFVGTPQTPVELKVLGIINGGFYFMVGKDLPPALPPPAPIPLPSGYNDRAPIDDASGIAFGSRTSFENDFKFLLLRMHLQAQFGFDILFADASDMSCSGYDPAGIMGWYASGQVFAQLAGKVSLVVDLWFASGEYDIFDIGASAVLAGGFARPSYMKGALNGHYSILGGAVDGNFNFPFELGEGCMDPGDGALSGLDPIGDLVPHHNQGMSAGSLPVDVGVQPEAIMNIKVNMPFTLNERNPNGSVTPKTYRFLVDKMELKKQDGGAVQAGTVVTASTNDRVVFEPAQFLDATTVYVITYRVRAEQRNGATWSPALRPDNNQPMTWTKAHTFKTGAGITVLTDEHINYSYPFRRQRYVLQDECRNGIIEVIADASTQPAFTAPEGKVRKYRMAFTPKTGGAPVFASATVTHSGNTHINYTLPQLLNDRVYVVQLIAKDSIDLSQMSVSAGNTGSGSGGNGLLSPLVVTGAMMMTATANTTSSSSFNNMVNTYRQGLQGYSVKPNEKVIYTYHFRTSKYNTLAAKTNAMTSFATEHTSVTDGVLKETVNPSFNGEGFDVFDVNGFTYGSTGQYTIPPLIILRDARTDQWNRTWATPVLYDYYPLLKESGCSDLELERSLTVVQNMWGANITVYHDSPDQYIGIPPIKTVRFAASYTSPALSDSDVQPFDPSQLATLEAGSTGPVAASKLRVLTPIQTSKDFLRLKTITADALTHCNPNAAENFLSPEFTTALERFRTATFKPLYRGNYQVNAFFQGPGECTPFSDWGQEVELSSGTITYPLPTGATPPGPAVQMGIGAGAGAIQQP